MKIFEIKATFDSSYGERSEIRQVTEKRFHDIEKMVNEGRFYKSVELIKDYGEQDTKWLDTWYEIGKSNLWIREAYDPPFSLNMFTECKTLDYLMDMFEHGNWCLGQAFYYKNLCFINQVDAGDEWLTIRDGIDFESASCGLMVKKDGREYFKLWVEDCLEATPYELKHLDYVKKSSVTG